MAYREDLSVGVLTEVGVYQRVTGGSVYVLERDGSGKILKATGTVAAASLIGDEWAKGGMYIKTDVAAASQGAYTNTGDTTTASMTILSGVTGGAVGDITLATGSMIIGAAGVGAAIDVKTTTGFLVGNGATAVLRTMNGDATMSNTGGVTIAAAAVTLAKMDALADGKIIVGSSTNRPAAVTPAGDVTITNAGATAIGAGKVTGAMLKSGVGYFVVNASTNFTTAVNVFGVGGAPCALTVTDVTCTAKDTNAGNVIVKNATATVATVAKATTAGLLTGQVSLANTAVAQSAAFTVESSTTDGDAVVRIYFTVA